MKEFPCRKCGKCCMNVEHSQLTDWLDRGDGICVYFDLSSKQCGIYDKRPDICRVKFQYEKYYFKYYSWDEFIDANQSVCKILPDKM